MPERIQTIQIKPKRVAFVLGAIVLFLVAAGIAGQVSKYIFGHDYVLGLVYQFDLDAEKNIPTYFSSGILLFSAFLFGVNALLAKKCNGVYFHFWILLSIIFVYLSIDEAISIHEMWITPLRQICNIKGVFYYAWLIIAIPLVLVFLLVFRNFFFHLSRKIRFLCMLATVLYIGGSIGFELLGGWHCYTHGEDNLIHSLIAITEETLEMAGIVILIYALLQNISNSAHGIVIRFEK